MGEGNVAVWKRPCRTAVITRGMATFYCWYKRWRRSAWWRRETWRWYSYWNTWGWDQRRSSADSWRRWKKWRWWKVSRRSPWWEKRRWFAEIVVHFSSRSVRKDLYIAVFVCPPSSFYSADGYCLTNDVNCTGQSPAWWQARLEQ